MASFDIVSKVDLQTLDNAVNSAKREMETRYDLKGTGSTLEFDKKQMKLELITNGEMHMDSIEKIVIGRMTKQQIDPRCLDFGNQQYAAGNNIKKDVLIKQGLDRELGKKLVKLIKSSKAKVQAQIMDDQVRVTGKKIDELQQVISLCKNENFDRPLQFVNMK